ncbi:N-alpha-acetyltransferase, non-catalitic subunit [Coemansia nantahalensis]|nr:N-alpha-acetyltransferase, non-catalitic subunit [Coemansia nantahalensis]
MAKDLADQAVRLALGDGDEAAVAEDADGAQWIDITQLARAGTRELAEGELLKASSLSLFGALTSIEVMDPRLDMGMVSAGDAAEIASWDIARRLTLGEALWVADTLFRSEMTWHGSASLLQTLFACNYFTAPDHRAFAIGEAAGDSAVRDAVLYPLLIATGRCCRRVADELNAGNLFTNEDVAPCPTPLRLFDDYTDAEALDLLDRADAYVAAQGESHEAALLRGLVGVRRRWLRVTACLAVASVLDDPAALARGLGELAGLRACHADYVAARRAAGGDAWVGQRAVRGAFDYRCMRKYPVTIPVKPRPLLDADAAHGVFARMVDDLDLVGDLARIGTAEHLAYFFLAAGRRDPPPQPFVRSLLMSMVLADGRVQLRAAPDAFGRRAVREMAACAVPAEFAAEAALNLVDWFRTMCQNGPRRHRVALKSLAAWDALQGEAEQLDIDAYAAAHPGADEQAALDPARNPFWLSSWAYHTKLLLLETALLAGVRLELYQAHELPSVLCYAMQVFEAHLAHLARWAPLVAGAQAACVGRWRVLVAAQKDLSMALWLAAHACDRLQLLGAPWAQGAADVCGALESEPAQRARYALRFRALAPLGSPVYVAFEQWQESSAQLDGYPVIELFEHAQRMLAGARLCLESARKPPAADATVRAWDQMCRSVHYVVVSNSVALARLLRTRPLADAPEAAVPGAVALAHRRRLAAPPPQPPPQPKRDRRKRKPARAPDDADAARKWRDGVARLVADAAVRVSWSCALDRNSDWPVFSFFG